MSIPSLTLFNTKKGEIIISPHRRYRTIISFGNGCIFGEICDRDRGNARLVDIEDVDILRLLARLVAAGLGKGAFRCPPGITRVGVRHECESIGCFALGADGETVAPIVAVTYTAYQAIAYINGGPRICARDTPAEAMLVAASTFMTDACAA